MAIAIRTCSAPSHRIIDTISQDQLLEAGPAAVVRERALRMVRSFEQFLRDNKDEIEVLQILYSKPYAVGQGECHPELVCIKAHGLS